jgi:hypothetical protein
MRKVTLVSFQKTYFKDSSQAAYILSCENPSFPQAAFSLTANFSHSNQGQGANMFLKEENE